MKPAAHLLGTAGLVAATLLCVSCAKTPEQQLADRWGMLHDYCTECHNDAERAGEMTLEHMNPSTVAAHPELWEKVVRRLRGGVMPPPGANHPDLDRVNEFVAALEASLDNAASARGVTPGHVAMHRLNRIEYQRAVRELLDVEIDASKLLPADGTSEGFDNVATALHVSPTYIDQFIAAAREVSLKAVSNPSPKPARAQYVSKVKNHTAHVEGLPLGTRDGLVVRHYFPADGDYVFYLDVTAEPGAELYAYPQGWLEYEHTAILTIDGRTAFEASLGGEQDLRDLDQRQIAAVNAIKDRFHHVHVPVKAGYHEIGATFIARSYAESDHRLQSFTPGEGVPDVPQLLGLQVVGPYDSSGISGTGPRSKLFVCYPETEAQEAPCAARILTRLARMAFRRPVTDEDMQPLLGFYRSGREAGGFETGIQKGVLAILASTKFLYRFDTEGPPPNLRAGDAYPVSDVELASRLAFFLWSEGPDETLLGLADRGQLSKPSVYAAQIERMFNDPRSKALVSSFAFQWLSLRKINSIEPDERLFPNFDEELRQAFVEEMSLFLDSVLRDDEKSVLELLSARYTFVNERLAAHYGITGVKGERFRRVELADPNRWGLLGKGSVLMSTSYADRTSPVLRGAWIMEHLLATPPTPPPPNVGTNLPAVSFEQPKSVRERLEQHRTVSSCNHCHGVIDPLGQALENYNAIGEWRTRERDSGVPIDPKGHLADGRAVASPSDVRAALMSEPEKFAETLTIQLLTYALGRTLEYYDMPVVRSIVREAAKSDYTFASIVAGVAKSAPFRMRTVPDAGVGEQ
jgi:hypothetical protein